MGENTKVYSIRETISLIVLCTPETEKRGEATSHARLHTSGLNLSEMTSERVWHQWGEDEYHASIKGKIK